MAAQPFQWPGRRTNNPAHDMLAAFLVIDIQRNYEWARELAQKIRAVRSGRITEWERIGNAYRLELSQQGALIEDLVDEDGPVQPVTLSDLARAVDAWIKTCK
jgi:hypothetical protein